MARTFASLSHKNLDPLDIEELGKKIVKKYQKLGLQIKITAFYHVERTGIYVYKIRTKRPKKAQIFLDLVEEVRWSFTRQFYLFRAQKERDGLFLVVSEIPIPKFDLLAAFRSRRFEKAVESMEIPVVIGRDLRGKIVIEDLAQLLHILVGGSTNSGKSVFLRCLITGILVCQSPNDVNLLLFDTGSNDLTIFEGVSLLSHPIIQDEETAVRVILALQREMNRRYQEPGEWPYLVCVADEASALISNFRDKNTQNTVCDALSDLLRRGRKVKIIWVLAAQDPTKENLKTELANMTTRVAFRCAKNQNSTTILDESGAENLDGNGDLLFKSSGYPTPLRLQGAFPEPELVEAIVSHSKQLYFDKNKKFIIPESAFVEDRDTWDTQDDLPAQKLENGDAYDRSICQVILWTLEQNRISVNRIEEEFKMSNRRAKKIMDALEMLGIVGEQESTTPRKVICKCYEDLSDSVLELLIRNGVPIAQIKEVFCQNSISGEEDKNAE